MKNKNQKKLADSIQSYLNTNKNLGRSYQKKNIDEIWAEIVGPTIYNYTTNIKLVGNSLKMRVSSSPLKQELNFKKDELISKVNERLPYEKINELIFI